VARVNVDQWVRDEYGGAVISRVRQVSAVEAVGRQEPMGTDVKIVNRAGDVGVAVTAKGSAYNEEQPTGDDIALTARKFTALIRIAEEDVADLSNSGVANYIQQKQLDWASSYAKMFDNACLGVNAASNGTTVPFTSVYRAATTADATVGYTANANVVDAGPSVSYAELSSLVGRVETSNYYDPGNYVVIAHPAFLGELRGVLDTQNRPIFQDTQQANGQATLFGLQIRFSLGAVVSATATRSQAVGGAVKGTAGNPLMIVAPKDQLIVGVRSGPEYAQISGWDGASAVTDEALIKMRARRGFSVGDPTSVAVLERTV
jgi:HK97 family phage major capsid protein